MVRVEKTVELTPADKRGLRIGIVWWGLIGILSVIIPSIFIYRALPRVVNGPWHDMDVLLIVLLIVLFCIALPALLIFISYATISDYLKDFRGNVKQILIVPVEDKIEQPRHRRLSSYYVIVNKTKYPINSSIYRELEIGDLVMFHAMPVSKKLLKDIEKYEGENPNLG